MPTLICTPPWIQSRLYSAIPAVGGLTSCNSFIFCYCCLFWATLLTVLGESYGMLGMEPRCAKCKANVSPAVLLLQLLHLYHLQQAQT